MEDNIIEKQQPLQWRNHCHSIHSNQVYYWNVCTLLALGYRHLRTGSRSGYSAHLLISQQGPSDLLPGAVTFDANPSRIICRKTQI